MESDFLAIPSIHYKSRKDSQPQNLYAHLGSIGNPSTSTPQHSFLKKIFSKGKTKEILGDASPMRGVLKIM
jgi:hypothetical protein